MFRIFACGWLTLAIPFFGLGEEPEEETYLALRSPAQYFAAESHDSHYWTVLFPDDPPFSYACLYLPSFNREPSLTTGVFNPRRCLLECYGELVPISQCYAPVKGRLHTRYVNYIMYPETPESIPPDRLLVVTKKTPARHAADMSRATVLTF